MEFDAKSNDIWCLGVCLFMLSLGGMPWSRSSESDKAFNKIMSGGITKLLRAWKRRHYVDDQLLLLFGSIFKFEDERAGIKQIKQCSWFKN